MAQMEYDETRGLEFEVIDADTATALMSGDLPVLGTPRLVAWLEAATCEAARPLLKDGQTTVGTRVVVEHRAPSAVGASVRVVTRLADAEGRSPTFDVEARDVASGRVLAEGVISRAIVDAGRFMDRLAHGS